MEALRQTAAARIQKQIRRSMQKKPEESLLSKLDRNFDSAACLTEPTPRTSGTSQGASCRRPAPLAQIEGGTTMSAWSRMVVSQIRGSSVQVGNITVPTLRGTTRVRDMNRDQIHGTTHPAAGHMPWVTL